MPRMLPLASILCAALAAFPALAQSTPASSPAAPATPHPITLDDLFRFQDVGDPQVSPDGQWVAYTLTHTDTAADKRITDIWMVSWDGSQDIQLTYNTDSSSSSPRWSPDGKYISFEADRPGKAKGTQVWVLDRRGGEARQLTDVKGHLGAYAWSPDSKKLLLTIKADDEPENDDKKGDKKEEKPKPIVIDRYHFKQDIQGYLTGTNRNLLYLYDIDTKKLEKLTNDSAHDEGNAVWSPDEPKSPMSATTTPTGTAPSTPTSSSSTPPPTLPPNSSPPSRVKTAAASPGAPTARPSPMPRAAIQSTRNTTSMSSPSSAPTEHPRASSPPNSTAASPHRILLPTANPSPFSSPTTAPNTRSPSTSPTAPQSASSTTPASPSQSTTLPTTTSSSGPPTPAPPTSLPSKTASCVSSPATTTP